MGGGAGGELWGAVGCACEAPRGVHRTTNADSWSSSASSRDWTPSWRRSVADHTSSWQRFCIVAAAYVSTVSSTSSRHGIRRYSVPHWRSACFVAAELGSTASEARLDIR